MYVIIFIFTGQLTKKTSNTLNIIQQIIMGTVAEDMPNNRVISTREIVPRGVISPSNQNYFQLIVKSKFRISFDIYLILITKL